MIFISNTSSIFLLSFHFGLVLLNCIINMNVEQQQSKRFRDKQNYLNVQSIQRQKKTYISPVKLYNNEESSLQKINKSSLEKKNKLQNEEYGNLLKEQMTMSKIEDENLLSKSRKVDAENASYLKENYPYGFEGVKVCEGVIEKYKASNYIIQKDLLQKFEKEAEEFRKNRIKKYRQEPVQQERRVYQERFTEPVRQTDNTSLLMMKAEQQKRRQAMLELEAIRQKEREDEERRRRKEQERQRRRQRRNQVYLKREKENLVKVGNMLRQIDHRLKENSSKLKADLQDLRNQLKSTPKFSRVSNEHLFNIASKISENTKSCSKIPVIMYNSTVADSRLHYNDSSYAPRLHRKDIEDSSQNMKQVLKILRKNENRLKLLTEADSAQENCDLSSFSMIS